MGPPIISTTYAISCGQNVSEANLPHGVPASKRTTTGSGLFSFRSRGRFGAQCTPDSLAPQPAARLHRPPESEHLTNRRAEIRYEGTSSTKGHWFTFYDGASSGGREDDKQIAANRATEQWPITKRNGIAKAAEEAKATVLRTNLQRMMQKGDLPVSLFAIEGSTSV